MWLTLVGLAWEQHDQNGSYSAMKGEFRYNDICKLWGVKDSLPVRKQIQDCMASLRASNFIIHEPQEGMIIPTTYAPPLKWLTVLEKKTGDRASKEKIVVGFRYELNEKPQGITAIWIQEGFVNKSKIKDAGGYLSYSLKDIRAGVDQNYDNFKEALRGYPGGELGGKKILMDWLKLSDDKLRRRSYCKGELLRCLNNAKEEGELIEYSAVFPAHKGWLEEWLVKIIKEKQN
jgi:hypothetical protein